MGRTKRWGAAWRSVVAFSCFVALGGCDYLPNFLRFNGSVTTQSVEVRIVPGANGNSALAADLVFVYDGPLIDRLAAMTARQWFEERKSLSENFRHGFETVGYELEPGQTVPVKPLPAGRDYALALFFFANYDKGKPHRARLDRYGQVVITLGEQDFTIQETAPYAAKPKQDRRQR